MPSLEVVVNNLHVGFGSIHTEPYDLSDALQDLFLLAHSPRQRQICTRFSARLYPFWGAGKVANL